MKKIERVVLICVILIAFFVRFYKLGQIPAGFSWDEASVGYNAWTIGNWGRDEWGKYFPLTFESFGDHKNPVHVYLTVPFVTILGPSEFSTRASSAIFGVLNVLLIYLISKRFFSSKYVPLVASLLLAISPYNIQFSRFNHELNFALFFFLLGFLFFLKGLQEKKGRYLAFSFIAFGIDLITYHSSKFMSVSFVVLLCTLYFKDLLHYKKYFLVGVSIFLSFILLIFVNKDLLGLDRLSQTSTNDETLLQSKIYKKTQNPLLGKMEIAANKYKAYFSKDFLFLQGDPIPRHSVQAVGTFYKIEMLTLLVGFIVLLLGATKNKTYLLLLAWIFLAPIPATLGAEGTHAGRALFISGGWHMMSALGFVTLILLFNSKPLKLTFFALLFIGISQNFFNYLKYYYTAYDNRFSIEWQYGMRDVVKFASTRREYYKVYLTDAHAQPYIFTLFYTRTPLPTFLKTVKYNETGSRASNLVKSFDKYQFGLWDPIESWPDPHILYVLVPSKYDGLKYKHMFNVGKLIKYPDGGDAFYLVSGKGPEGLE